MTEATAMTSDDLETVRRHHDMLVQRAALELQADHIRETCPVDAQARLLQPIENQMHQLDAVITHLPV